MRGNLTIDKASMNMSYFLYTVQIIQKHGGKVSRVDFGKDMGEFIGIPSIKNGKENRTPYNKSKLPRYFGFVDTDVDSDGKNVLVLTNRGKALADYIACNDEAEASSKYFINPVHREDFINLIFESMIFDTFGKNNCGAETSDTDVEPPKVVFKTIRELGKATADEICFVMYGLNNGKFETFEQAIEEIRTNRKHFNYNYNTILEKWGVLNIAHDCKIINLFTDPSIRLLRIEKDTEIGKNFYYLNDTLDENHIKQIDTIQAIYNPLNLFIYGTSSYTTIIDWVTNTVLGRVSDDNFAYRIDARKEPLIGMKNEGKWKPGALEKALLQAFRYPKKNVFLMIENTSEEEFPILFGAYLPLLKRINSLSSNDNGDSVTEIIATDTYDYLVDKSIGAKNRLKNGKVFFPSNLQIVSTIKEGESIMDKTFDYEFTRCLVNDGCSDNNGDETEERVTGGTNIILYGVPGSGKSWKIATEYCKDEKYMERIVFHPDYTYSDFVGQILPQINQETKKVEYVFSEGPFTKIMMKAKKNPGHMFYLVIEEINRGNAAAIFGEIFQLLDRDEDGTSSYGITNFDIANKVYDGDIEHKIKLFSNLTIIATMNTSDQNVFALDTAFQRRWDMKHVPNKFKDNHGEDLIVGSQIKWGSFMRVVNDYIIEVSNSFAGSADKRLGAYFARVSELKREKFPEKVLKYLWDDAFKLNPNTIFKENMTTLEKVIEAYEDASETDPLEVVLKKNVYDEMKNK